MIQKKNVLNTVPVICLGALLLGAAYGQLHTPMTPPPITALASDILPTTGNVRALVVVVDFADVAEDDVAVRLSLPNQLVVGVFQKVFKVDQMLQIFQMFPLPS